MRDRQAAAAMWRKPAGRRCRQHLRTCRRLLVGALWCGGGIGLGSLVALGRGRPLAHGALVCLLDWRAMRKSGNAI